MNYFEIDFLAKLKTLLTEAFKFKKYKAMNPALAVFTGIFMLPIVVCSFFVTAFLAALGFAYNVFASPIKGLHKLVNGEGKGVMHATQAIIYLLSWPLILFFYALISLMLLFILPSYALLSFLLYVWSLGGFKFHLFIKDESIEKEVTGSYKPILPFAFVIISAIILVVIPFIHGIICFIDLFYNYMEYAFPDIFFGEIYPIYVGVQIVFAVLISLLGLARHPKESAQPEVPEIQE